MIATAYRVGAASVYLHLGNAVHPRKTPARPPRRSCIADPHSAHARAPRREGVATSAFAVSDFALSRRSRSGPSDDDSRPATPGPPPGAATVSIVRLHAGYAEHPKKSPAEPFRGTIAAPQSGHVGSSISIRSRRGPDRKGSSLSTGSPLSSRSIDPSQVGKAEHDRNLPRDPDLTRIGRLHFGHDTSMSCLVVAVRIDSPLVSTRRPTPRSSVAAVRVPHWQTQTISSSARTGSGAARHSGHSAR